MQNLPWHVYFRTSHTLNKIQTLMKLRTKQVSPKSTKTSIKWQSVSGELWGSWRTGTILLTGTEKQNVLGDSSGGWFSQERVTKDERREKSAYNIEKQQLNILTPTVPGKLPLDSYEEQRGCCWLQLQQAGNVTSPIEPNTHYVYFTLGVFPRCQNWKRHISARTKHCNVITLIRTKFRTL